MANAAKKNVTARRLLQLALLAVTVFYASMCLTVFTLQRKLLYHPTIRSAQEVDQLAQADHMERWTNAVGQDIGLRRLATNQPALGTVFMCYGNASTAVHCSVYADAIQSAAELDFYVLEYPGYEDRPGPATKQTLTAAANEAFQCLDTNRPIYLVGESLGTGLTSYLAGEFPQRVAGIMLLSPYNRLADVAQYQYPMLPARWLLEDNFRSEDYLKNYHGIIGMMIDGRDTVVPAQFGHRLYDSCSGVKRLWEFPDCNHVELGEPPETFWRDVTAFWQSGQAYKTTAAR